ncbi:MAG: hypothetical protein MUE59_01110 [Thiobacillaceae bacterium]|jgi:hypothetical protein|nr:hypothetical protein [Thiobacillaceae bacterium]
MNNDHPSTRHAPWPRWSKWLINLLIVAAVGGLIWSQLPRGAYPTDLSRIGAGQPALVLAHDANFAAGMAVMELMNVIRSDYPEVEFLVAHLGLAEGQAFASRHAARDGSVMLFSAKGELVDTLHQPQTVDALRQALAQAFGLRDCGPGESGEACAPLPLSPDSRP